MAHLGPGGEVKQKDCATHGASAWPADDVTLARLTIVFAFDIFFYESRLAVALAVALVFLCFN